MDDVAEACEDVLSVSSLFLLLTAAAMMIAVITTAAITAPIIKPGFTTLSFFVFAGVCFTGDFFGVLFLFFFFAIVSYPFIDFRITNQIIPHFYVFFN